MLKALFEFLRTRWNHFKECWEHAQHHWAVSVIAAFVLLYSVWTEYVEPWVEVPQMHIKKLPLSWALMIAFAALFFIVLEGSYRKLKDSKNVAVEVPELYLQYEEGYKNTLEYSAFFLRVEGERKASNVEISSEPTVGDNHVRLEMKWANPGHPIGTTTVPVKADCVYHKDGRSALYHGRGGDQIYTYFDHKRDNPRELIVTLNYTDVGGRACPPRKFRVHQDAPHITDAKISCEPVRLSCI